MPLLGALAEFTALSVIPSADFNTNFSDIRTWANAYPVLKDVAATLNPAVTASAGSARAYTLSPTLTAAANDDELTALRIAPTFTPGAFTGVLQQALHVTGGTSKFDGPVSMTSTLAVTSTVTGGTYNGQTISDSASFTGTCTVAGQFTSTLADGTAPFVITSLTKVANLNADLLDGLDASAFATASHTHTFASLTSPPTTLSGYGITDAAAASHTHTFASLTSKPTTVAGYGITDHATFAAGLSLAASQSIVMGSITAIGESSGNLTLASENTATYVRLNHGATEVARAIGSAFLVGTTVLGSTPAGGIVTKNGVGLYGVNAAGTDTLRLIGSNSANQTEIACNSAALSLTNPSINASATSGANTLPAQPAAFLDVNIGGVARRIPYYNT